MAILFSKEFNIDKEMLKEVGVFDCLVDKDSNFFINLKCLKATNVPEFLHAYEKINRYFYEIGLLLKNASPNDKRYREAFRRFNFPEVNGINLGFSDSKRGAGFGLQLRQQIIKDAHEIIQCGVTEPELFHLLSLFEDNVGPDRISDMIARIIYSDIVEYSKRVYRELGICPEKYPLYRFKQGIPINPYKNIGLLLLPESILHELPIARCWDDIDNACRENEIIRAEINKLAGDKFFQAATSEKKEFMRDDIFKNPDRAKTIIEGYINASIGEFDPYKDVDYLVGHIESTFELKESVKTTSYEAALDIIDNYKEFIEYHRGYSFIQNAPSRQKEKFAQRTLHAVALMFCKCFNWDISPETDSGRGPTDFKISRGMDKTVAEIKLTSNADCVHGLEVQIEEYAKAEGTNQKIFILIDTGVCSFRINDVKTKYAEMQKNGLNPAEVIVIDAKEKLSASKYKES